jgi:signal transduction histidine kinase
LTSDKGAAIVEIKDTGHGMSKTFIRERLFKPFESTKSAGMGVGVFESREYVHELGGQLEVTSDPSSGTTFRMTLPLHNQNHAVERSA